MLKTLQLITCFCAVFQSKTFDLKLITAVRHGIEKNLEYINNNYEKMNEDCWLGVVLATAIIKDSYQNGTHVMDNSSVKLLRISYNILQKGITSSNTIKTWVVNYILDWHIWQKNIIYKINTLDPKAQTPKVKILENMYKNQNLSIEYPTSDFCLQDLINLTTTFTPVECHVNSECWNKFYRYDKPASAYILTHKLLLLQLAKLRNCLISNNEYEFKSRKLCSQILAEVNSADYFDVLDDIFDLFLEQVVVCGYEGYTEFFKIKWLVYILKSQRKSGCFPSSLGDNLKSRIKRDTNILADGCADHTTGLGTAVLSLYYNIMIKKNINVV